MAQISFQRALCFTGLVSPCVCNCAASEIHTDSYERAGDSYASKYSARHAEGHRKFVTERGIKLAVALSPDQV